MIKTFHEAPLSIVDHVSEMTSGDYFLANLLDESSEYKDWVKKSVSSKRETILDNGLFETEVPAEPEWFANYVREVNATWYIVPDALEDKDLTITQFKSFVKDFPDLPGSKIGVVQGKTYDEIVECYQFMSEHADMIAISFDYSLFESLFNSEKNKYHSWMKGRQWLIDQLERDEVINHNKPHHLLGCGLASEFKHYVGKSYIYSIDTSNPVVAGLKGYQYEKYDDGFRLDDKPSEKLFTLINSEASSDQLKLITYNINKFVENIT